MLRHSHPRNGDPTAPAAPHPQVPSTGSGALRVWVYLCVLLSILAITAHQDFGTLRWEMLALATGGFVVSWHRRRRRNTWLKAALVLGCLLAGWDFLRALAAAPYHTSIPLTVFLLWLQVLHSFDLPRRRDLLFSLLTSLVLMAVAAAFSLDLRFTLYLIPYLVAAVAALMLNAAEAAREAAGSGRPAPAAEGATEEAGRAGSGLRILAGLRETAGPAVRAAVPLAALAVLVFLATPRLDGLFITSFPFTPRVPLGPTLDGEVVNPAYPAGAGSGTAVFNPHGYFGFSPTVDLRLRGRLNDALVMRVRAGEPRLWRALVFDVYTGTGWRIGDDRVRRHTAVVPPIEVLRGRDDSDVGRRGARRLIQTFYIERQQPNVAFAAPRVEEIYFPGRHVFVDRYSAVRLPFVLEPGMIYTVVSRVVDPAPAQLAAAGDRYPEELRARYLQVPDTVPQRVRRLASEITEGARTPYERVQRVHRYLWTHFRYDLTIPPQRRPGDAVDDFLFEERRGYCEQFASAMAILLRLAGVPARLATGYTPGTYHPLTGLWEVRNSDAHAWVEVFFPEVGWVEFEPTPGFAEPAALARTAPRWGFEGLARYLRTRWPGLPAWSAGRPGWASPLWAPAAKAALLPILIILVGARMGRRRRPADPRDGVLAAYARFLRVLRRRGLARAETETPREFARRAERALGWTEVRGMTAVVEEALYGPGITPRHVDAARLAADAVAGRAAAEAVVVRVRRAARLRLRRREGEPGRVGVGGEGRNGVSGFTLVELVVVLAILGVLLSLALPRYLGAREGALAAEAHQVLIELKRFAWMHYQEYETWVGVTDPAQLGFVPPPVSGSCWAYEIVPPGGTATQIQMRATGQAGGGRPVKCGLVAGESILVTLFGDGSSTKVGP